MHISVQFAARDASNEREESAALAHEFGVFFRTLTVDISPSIEKEEEEGLRVAYLEAFRRLLFAEPRVGQGKALKIIMIP